RHQQSCTSYSGKGRGQSFGRRYCRWSLTACNRKRRRQAEQVKAVERPRLQKMTTKSRIALQQPGAAGRECWPWSAHSPQAAAENLATPWRNVSISQGSPGAELQPRLIHVAGDTAFPQQSYERRSRLDGR